MDEIPELEEIETRKEPGTSRGSRGSQRRAGPSERGENVHHHYHPPPQGRPYGRLTRSTSDKWIGGVCGGLARHFNMDPTLVRVLWIVVLVVSVGFGVLAYLLMWALVEKDPYPYQYPTPGPGWDRRDGRKVHYHYHERPGQGGRRR